VHGAGRVPDLDDLDLDAGGVKREKRGVIVNQFLQSVSNPAVYAGGDAAARGPPLTPKANHDAGVLRRALHALSRWGTMRRTEVGCCDPT